MNDDKFAIGPLASVAVFDDEIVHAGSDNLIVDAELIPGIAKGFAIMLDCHYQLAGVGKNSDSATLCQSQKLNSVADFTARV